MVARKDLVIILLAFAVYSNTLFSQCETWINSSQKEDAENAHSNYRSALKMKDYNLAFGEWNKAYTIAPAADGMRDFHFTDGIKIYKEQLKAESDPGKKKEIIAKIVSLYEQCASCYEKQAIKIKSCNDADCYTQKAGQLKGRLGFDMFYEFNSDYVTNLAAFEESLEKGGNNVEYIIFEPIANIVVYQFKNGKMDAQKARDLHEKLVEVADWNIENSTNYKAYYESSKARMLAKFAEIESEIFDCAYFKSKLEPKYKENPNDPDVVKYVYNKLIQEGCDRDDPFVSKLRVVYEEYAEEENARLQAEFEAKNPGVLASRLYKEGDFEGAINKYGQALEAEDDPDKRAQYYFNIASIELRKLGRLQSARTNARKALELRKNWGHPYILIGDIYAQSSKSCGSDAFYQRIIILAALDKYIYARSIDESVKEEANRKIGIYSSSKPSKDDAFMRGFKDGQTLDTGCWIAEKVKLRVQ
jgi:tetratricopeptide (TPR) repeat protein